MICSTEPFCTIIAPTNTVSAHRIVSSVNASTFSSTSLRSQSCGNMLAMVSKPKGTWAAFFRMIFIMCLKFQKVSGMSGQTKRAFMYFFPLSRLELQRQRDFTNDNRSGDSGQEDPLRALFSGCVSHQGPYRGAEEAPGTGAAVVGPAGLSRNLSNFESGLSSSVVSAPNTF